MRPHDYAFKVAMFVAVILLATTVTAWAETKKPTPKREPEAGEAAGTAGVVAPKASAAAPTRRLNAKKSGKPVDRVDKANTFEQRSK